VYYWDSYFTMIGLKASGLSDMVENMVENFAHLIKIIGFIPNGNRTYYLGRSQPPFFSLMIKLLAEIKGPQVLANYLLPLQKEYDYWVRGKEKLTESNRCVQHSVRLSEEVQLSRYYDAYNTPRPESYREDVELLHTSVQLPTQLYQHLRAGAESGWDYSSRWFKDGLHFSSIHTADIIPVDLNCLLYHHEITLAQTYQNCLHYSMSAYYKSLAHKRREAILQYCWNSNAGFFVDYDFVEQKQKQELTLAGITPLYFNIAEQYQADRVAEKLTSDFLKPGGLVTTLKTTGQQWDAPNGWAPLQWLAIIGLENYGHHALAKTIAQRWLALNEKVYANTGKMMEKYNVVDVNQEAGGGEYPGQDGFGWTNGVYLELLKRYGHP
jgi:alpha,alpha-trehalase